MLLCLLFCVWLVLCYCLLFDCFCFFVLRVVPVVFVCGMFLFIVFCFCDVLCWRYLIVVGA